MCVKSTQGIGTCNKDEKQDDVYSVGDYYSVLLGGAWHRRSGAAHVMKVLAMLFECHHFRETRPPLIRNAITHVLFSIAAHCLLTATESQHQV